MRSVGESGEQDGGSPQRRALAAYLAMAKETPDWSRRLVMLAAAKDAIPFALAGVVAGAAVLWTCAEQGLLRESSVAGWIDFQVTTLSEAVRILKNELRKGLPVSVGVLDARGRVWPEAVERGLQPQALLAGEAEQEAARILLARGAERLQMGPSVRLDAHVGETWRARKAADEALLASAQRLAGPERAVAMRWLRSVPRLFPRDTTRWYAAAWAASKDDR
ncbi:hypothetical protein [Terriglobus sp.]|uniref:hypothetical protein n=1 Tax=Terriglobus sp. TaxID=1889013 RepID=UPI003B00D4CC